MPSKNKHAPPNTRPCLTRWQGWQRGTAKHRRITQRDIFAKIPVASLPHACLYMAVENLSSLLRPGGFILAKYIMTIPRKIDIDKYSPQNKIDGWLRCFCSFWSGPLPPPKIPFTTMLQRMTSENKKKRTWRWKNDHLSLRMYLLLKMVKFHFDDDFFYSKWWFSVAMLGFGEAPSFLLRGMLRQHPRGMVVSLQISLEAVCLREDFELIQSGSNKLSAGCQTTSNQHAIVIPIFQYLKVQATKTETETILLFSCISRSSQHQLVGS